MANGWDKVKFNFSGSCIVTVSINQEEGVYICELFQEIFLDNINDIQRIYIEDGAGWGFYLANLKSILEGGLDLRNKNTAIKKVINA